MELLFAFAAISTCPREHGQMGNAIDSTADCGSVWPMRRLIAALSLVLVVSDATWCLDGCVERSNYATSSAPTESTCTICVVPFAVSVQFDLVPDRLPMQVQDAPLAPRLVTAPPDSIDHPPRLL